MTSDVSSLIYNTENFAAAFEEESNFCAGATQIHTHSPTCVKYSISRQGKSCDACRFKAPWKLVERTHFTEDGVLEIRRNHDMVNRWNRAMAVGLRHNHDISFIATQRKSLAIIYYVTNYATKVEDPVWKRAAAAAQIFRDMGAGIRENQADAVDDARKNKTRQFLMKVANRVFTEKPLSQVEVMASLLGYSMEYTNSKVWSFLNVTFLYWRIFGQWNLLQVASSANGPVDDNVLLVENGQKISLTDAYPNRGKLLESLSLYEYASIIILRRKGRGGGNWGEVEFDSEWPLAETWIQQLRKPGEQATVCLDGFLSMDFDEEDDIYYRR